ncbi:MAG: hypothetical protein KJO07_16510 [Deltaproteobacteria bacterium]|nr:hypothetical protein [Deltaproteobacteria bacterium]
MKRHDLTIGDLCLDLYERLAVDLCDSDAAAIISAAELNRRIADLPAPPPETSSIVLAAPRSAEHGCNRRTRRRAA